MTSSTLLFALLTPLVTSAPLEPRYVDMAQVLNSVDQGKRAKARLKKEFEAKQKKLDQLQKELKSRKDSFDKKAAVMKAEARQQQQQELQGRFVELQQTYMKLQKELIDEETKVTQEIAAKIRKVVSKIGDREGYALVLDIGDTVLYYKRHLDITEQVVNDYNKQYKSN